MSEGFLKFPDGFVWGAATASYQIEGAHDADGRGESIWDRFSHTPGKVLNGDTGDVACDHYHRYREDVALMRELGLKAYRFSVAWPRVFPAGRCKLNPAGLDFYERLVDALLAVGIQPYVTLYHWDLPQALQDEGGWANRDTIYHFRDYAAEVGRRLGGRIKAWITHNEPWVVAFIGNLLGNHAPGLKDLRTAIQISHHLLVSHGEAVKALRQVLPGESQVGITLDLVPQYPVTDSEADKAATQRYDGFRNRWFLDPLFRGGYPQDMLDMFGELAPQTQPEDMKTIAQKIDFLGINSYTRNFVKHDPTVPVFQARWQEYWLGEEQIPGREYTDVGWEVFPHSLYQVIKRAGTEYGLQKLYVTENGAAFPDEVGPNGEVDDPKRVAYLKSYLAACHQAIQEGIGLKGYFVWSLMDNFEWALGYSKRFGIVYVDYPTQRRILKTSAKWYRQVIARNGFEV